MAYYTLTPHIRDPSGNEYISSFCSGDWKVFVNNVWLELNPSNTRIRDKNNASWIEPCDGQIVEIPVSANDTKLSCQCYSESITSLYSTELKEYVEGKADSTFSMTLYGSLLTTCDTTDIAYILAYCSGMLKLYCFNKAEALITILSIDALLTHPSKASLYTTNDNSLTIRLFDATYYVDANNVISSNAESYNIPDYESGVLGSHYIIDSGSVFVNNVLQSFTLPKNASYSVLYYNRLLCYGVLLNGVLSIYSEAGNIVATSVTDALTLQFFHNDYEFVVEGHPNYITIKAL